MESFKRAAVRVLIGGLPLTVGACAGSSYMFAEANETATPPPAETAPSLILTAPPTTVTTATSNNALPEAPKLEPVPHDDEDHDVGKATGLRAAKQARRMVGKRYKLGGSKPTIGFDSSGLVHYSFAQAGAKIPRTTEEQRNASKNIRLMDLQAGDLLFFDLEGKKNFHVGLYLGNEQFVHAPPSAKRVRRDRLDTPYWREHLSEARRIQTKSVP
jgi:cell wall-associated NlpC family hydrolase